VKRFLLSAGLLYAMQSAHTALGSDVSIRVLLSVAAILAADRLLCLSWPKRNYVREYFADELKKGNR
jgi:hypothetical protein